MVDPTNGGMEILKDTEEALIELGARPHWGQVHYLAGGISGNAQITGGGTTLPGKLLAAVDCRRPIGWLSGEQGCSTI